MSYASARTPEQDEQDEPQEVSEASDGTTSSDCSRVVSFLRNLNQHDDESGCTTSTAEIVQAVAQSRPSDLEECILASSSNVPQQPRGGFERLWAACARDATHGARAVARLLPLLARMDCLKFACFCVKLVQQRHEEEEQEDDVFQEGQQILGELLGGDTEDGLAASHRDPETEGIVPSVLPGYQVLSLPLPEEKAGGQELVSVAFYLPFTDREGLTQALALRPEVAWQMGRAMVQLLGDATTAPRALEEPPLLAKVYGALMAGHRTRSKEWESLREVAESVEKEVSNIKNRLLISMQKADNEEAVRADLVLHLNCVDKLMDDSRKDPEAVQHISGELEEIVQNAASAGHTIHYLRSMKRLDANVLRKATRLVGQISRNEKPEVTQLLEALYVYTPKDSSEDPPENSVAFCFERPESVRLALSLIFRVFQVDDIVLKGRIALFLCLRLSYDKKIATAQDREGVDASLVLLARDYVKNFDNLRNLGMVRNEHGEWEFREFQSFMNNPFYMRLLLRAHADFGILRCDDFTNILREMYRSKAILELVNGDDSRGGKRGVILTATATVSPSTCEPSFGGAESEAALDTYDLHVSWKTLLKIGDISAHLGLNPHVVDLLLDEKLKLGKKLKFSVASELLKRFKTPFIPSDENTVWNIEVKERFRTHRYGVKVKGSFQLTPNSNEFRFIRESLWRGLEKYMRVKLSITAVDDKDAMATCWICTEQHRVGARDVWVDLTDCCSQALCVKCFDRCTRLDELPLGLFPRCPFCACALNLHALDRYQETTVSGEIQTRGKLLAWMQAHVRLDDGDGSFCAPESVVAALNKSHYFSPCKSCGCAIAVRRQCVAGTTDLPDTCSVCVAARPLDVKMCPQCSTKIERIGSFNDVACVCGQHFCYVCGAAVEDRDPEHYVYGYYAQRCVFMRTVQKVISKSGRAGFKDQNAVDEADKPKPSMSGGPDFKDQVRNVPGPDFFKDRGAPSDEARRESRNAVDEADKSKPPMSGGPEFKDQVRSVPLERRVPPAALGGPDFFKDRGAPSDEARRESRVDGNIPKPVAGGPAFKDQVRSRPSNVQRYEHQLMHSRLPNFKDQAAGEVGLSRGQGAANDNQSPPQRSPSFKDQLKETSASPPGHPSNNPRSNPRRLTAASIAAASGVLPSFKDQVLDISPAEQMRRRSTAVEGNKAAEPARNEVEQSKSDDCQENDDDDDDQNAVSTSTSGSEEAKGTRDRGA